jgi:hypothetical protein
MKKNIFIAVLFSVMLHYSATGSNGNDLLEADQKTEIEILQSDEDLSKFTKNETVSFRLVYGLNFAAKKKIKQMAFEELKKMASSKGYTHLLIDEKASNKKCQEVRKRNYTVVFVGKAYK